MFICDIVCFMIPETLEWPQVNSKTETQSRGEARETGREVPHCQLGRLTGCYTLLTLEMKNLRLHVASNSSSIDGTDPNLLLMYAKLLL